MKRYKYLRSQDKLSIQIFIIVWITVSVLLTLYPVFITIVNSLKSDYSIRASIFTMPDLFGGGFGATVGENYKIAWNGTETITGMKVYFLRSVLLAFIGAFFTCVIGTILGYIFTYKEFHFKEVLFMIYLAVMMLPSIMGMPTLIPFVSRTLGLKDSYVGYLLPILSGGQVTSLFLFRTFFGAQPKSVYESAKIEGANDVQIYAQLTVPLALPIILYCFVGSVSSQYNDYLWPTLIFERNITLMPMMKRLEEFYTKSRMNGAIYAMYMISGIPLIITSAISMKFFASGDFAAGMKL
ncbi:MAG: carbohydrate ABC transporter permease [Clostridiales bacterium]|nr:carbohydrate ABC transporter permease [Clostridiales bacterium]